MAESDWSTRPISIAVLDIDETGSVPDHELLMDLIRHRYDRFTKRKNLAWEAEAQVSGFRLSVWGDERDRQMRSPEYGDFLSAVTGADVVFLRVEMFGSGESSHSRMEMVFRDAKLGQDVISDSFGREAEFTQDVIRSLRARNPHAFLIVAVDPRNPVFGTSEIIPGTIVKGSPQYSRAVFEIGNTMAEPTNETGPDHLGYLGYLDKLLDQIHELKRSSYRGREAGEGPESLGRN